MSGYGRHLQTRQLAAAVVLAQLAAILVTLALQWALRRAVPSAADHPPRRHYLSVEEIRRLVREELAVGQLRRDEAIEERRRAAEARSEPEDEITRGAARADGCPPLLDGLHAPLRPDGLKAESPPWQVVNKAAKNGRRHHKGAKQLHGQASS